MQVGLDRIEEALPLLRGARVGLLAHPASVNRGLVHVSDVLDAKSVKPVVVFGPEHGYGGEAQDMIGVPDARDARGTPVKSLYGERFEDLSPRAEDLAGIDVLLIDLQDVGSRYYTFVWTAVLAMRACAKAGVRVVVFDRPNPLGGDARAIEGVMQEERCLSFVGLEPIAVRHGLTLGEIVAWRAEVEGIAKEQLAIVPVTGQKRETHAAFWDRPFVMPSPNMPTYETALVYPGGCLLEGTNLSEGRGTTRPFELVGAAWLDGVRLARALEDLALPGVTFRATTFRPTFHKHGGQICGAVQAHPVGPVSFRPYAAYLAMVTLAHHAHPEHFRFRTEKYEFVDDVPAFDLLTGSARARRMIEAGAPPEEVMELARVGEAELAIHADAQRACKLRAAC